MSRIPWNWLVFGLVMIVSRQAMEFVDRFRVARELLDNWTLAGFSDKINMLFSVHHLNESTFLFIPIKVRIDVIAFLNALSRMACAN